MELPERYWSTELQQWVYPAAVQLPPMPEPVHIDSIGYDSDTAFTADQMRAYALEAVRAERERCVRICEEREGQGGGRGWNQAMAHVAAAIRAQGR